MFDMIVSWWCIRSKSFSLFSICWLWFVWREHTQNVFDLWCFELSFAQYFERHFTMTRQEWAATKWMINQYYSELFVLIFRLWIVILTLEQLPRDFPFAQDIWPIWLQSYRIFCLQAPLTFWRCTMLRDKSAHRTTFLWLHLFAEQPRDVEWQVERNLVQCTDWHTPTSNSSKTYRLINKLMIFLSNEHVSRSWLRWN